MKVIALLCAVLWAFAGGMGYAQVSPVPARLAIEGPKDVTPGEQGKFKVKLLDVQGHPITSNSDIKLTVNAPGAEVDHRTIIIPKGASSADLTVSKNAAGISDIHVEQADHAGSGLAANTQVGLEGDESYTPVPPLRLRISVEPGSKLKAGLDAATIIVRCLDSRNLTIPAQQNIKVAFPGLGNALNPVQISMARGDLYGEAALQEVQPQVVTLTPVSSPPMSIFSDTSSVEFVSPISGLRLIAEHSYIKALMHPHIQLKLGLTDGQGNWIASDRDRTIVLQVDPPNAGTLSSADVTIPQGQSVAEVTFTPSMEGKSTIKAITGEPLAVQNATVEFYYAAAYFWLIAALGGLIGGAVRNALGDDHSRKKIITHLAGGCAVGVIAYLIAPLLVAVSLKPAGLENGSKIFEAFVWGVFGGGTGVSMLGKILSVRSTQKTEAAAGAAGKGAGQP